MSLIVISLLLSFPVYSFYLRTTEVPDVLTTEVNEAEEVQNALCRISTKELEASANATITRQLKGVCTSNQLESKLNKLQTRILQEIDHVKYILKQNGFKVAEKPTKLSHNYDADEIFVKKSTKSLHPVISRDDEIHAYNDTVRQTNEGNKYIYYWEVMNIGKLLSNSDMYKSSPPFSVFGHTLYLQLYPNYGERGYFGIQLKPSSNGFLKKHKIYIINQINAELDIDSGYLYGLRGESMFYLNEYNVKEPGFINKNSMIIKLEIFLNS